MNILLDRCRAGIRYLAIKKMEILIPAPTDTTDMSTYQSTDDYTPPVAVARPICSL